MTGKNISSWLIADNSWQNLGELFVWLLVFGDLTYLGYILIAPSGHISWQQ